MAQIPMYQGMVNSPQTELATAVDDTQTTIDVQNGDSLPDAPNLAVIIGGELSETILYTEKTGNTLSGITRGFQGEARGWSLGTKIARNGTEYDHKAFKDNIEDLQEQIEGITPESIGAETPTGAQAKADAAQIAAEQSAQSLVNDLQTEVNQLDSDLTTHTATEVHEGEAHGLRVNPTTLEFEYFNGTTWTAVKGGISETTANITYYINPTTGLDTNDGLTEGTAFKTIMHAVSLLPKIISHDVNINLADGFYDEGVNIKGLFDGGGRVVLGRTGAAAGAISLRHIALTAVGCEMRVDYLTVVNTSYYGVFINKCKIVFISSLRKVVTASSPVIFVSGADLIMRNSTLSNSANAAIQASSLANVLSINNNGSGNAVGLSAGDGATIIKNSTQPSGTTAESTSTGGLIR
jgi:hypothetical protein